MDRKIQKEEWLKQAKKEFKEHYNVKEYISTLILIWIEEMLYKNTKENGKN